MRYFASVLALIVAASALGSQARASNVIVHLRTGAAGYTSANGHGHGKARLCGGNRGYAAGGRQTVVTEDFFRPCYSMAPERSTHRCRPFRGLALLDGREQHCYPNCYTGTPCSCCDHTLRHVRPCSAEHLMYAALIKIAHKRTYTYLTPQTCPPV